MIKEVFYLRSIACLSIVLGHSIASALNWFPYVSVESQGMKDIWGTVIELLLFGTPVFVFISALVLSNAYPNGTPKGFLLKRAKFILVPYVIMGGCYAVFACLVEGSFSSLANKVFSHIFLGQFHGYFIIIIFQFYLLHMVFHKIVSVVSIRRLLVYSLLINAAYLVIAGKYLNNAGLGVQIWWLPLFAWIFYYVLAYHIGKHLEEYRAKLNKYLAFLLIGSAAAGGLVVLLSDAGIFSSGSKRIDVLLYTIFVCFAIFALASKAEKVPAWISAVSSYSFGIYWLHVFFIAVLHKMFKFLPAPIQQYFNLPLYILYLFIASTLLSILSVYLVTRHSWGEYIVGKIGIGARGKRYKGMREQSLSMAK